MAIGTQNVVHLRSRFSSEKSRERESKRAEPPPESRTANPQLVAAGLGEGYSKLTPQPFTKVTKTFEMGKVKVSSDCIFIFCLSLGVNNSSDVWLP